MFTKILCTSMLTAAFSASLFAQGQPTVPALDLLFRRANPPATVGNFAPQQADPCEIITIEGVGFPTDPNDICLRGPNGVGFDVISVSPDGTLITAKVRDVATAGAGPLMIHRGEGVQVDPIDFPAIPGAVVIEPIKVWQGVDDPADSDMSASTFETLSETPSSSNWTYDSSRDGALCVMVSGAWEPDTQIKFDVHFNVDDFADNSVTHYDCFSGWIQVNNTSPQLCAFSIALVIVQSLELSPLGAPEGLSFDVEQIGPDDFKITLRADGGRIIGGGGNFTVG